MFKWLITLAILYIIYRWWESRRRYLENGGSDQIEDEGEYTDYEEVD